MDKLFRSKCAEGGLDPSTPCFTTLRVHLTVSKETCRGFCFALSFSN